MKARMKKLISIKSIPILALALLIVLGTAWAADHYPVSGVGKVSLYTLHGPVTLTIRGKDWMGEVDIELGKVIVRPGGVTQYYDIVHNFYDEVGNTFTTIGDEITAPTGDMKLLKLSGYMEITEGTGLFKDACGRLSVRGEMTPSMATFEVNGAMSF